jgi:hypothetical protein
MPAIAGLEYWQDPQSGAPWQQNQAIAPGTTWTRTVWVSMDPNATLPTGAFPIAFQACAPPGGGDADTEAATPVQAASTLNSWHVYWPGSTWGGGQAVTIAGLDSSTTGTPHGDTARAFVNRLYVKEGITIPMPTAPEIMNYRWAKAGGPAASALFFVDAVVKEEPDDPVYVTVVETAMRSRSTGAGAPFVPEKGFAGPNGRDNPQTRKIIPNERPAQNASQEPKNLREETLKRGQPWRVIVWADAPEVDAYTNSPIEELEATQVITVRDARGTVLGSITIKFTELMQAGKVTFQPQVIEQNPAS